MPALTNGSRDDDDGRHTTSEATAFPSPAFSATETSDATVNGYLPTPALSPITESDMPSTPEIDGQLDGAVGLGINGHNGELEHAQDEASVVAGVDGPAEAGSEVVKTPSHSGEKRSPTITHISSPAQSDRVLKLSPAQIQQLTESPASLPVRRTSPVPENVSQLEPPAKRGSANGRVGRETPKANIAQQLDTEEQRRQDKEAGKADSDVDAKSPSLRPRLHLQSRAFSTPTLSRRKPASSSSKHNGTAQSSRHAPSPLHLDDKPNGTPSGGNLKPSPMPDSLPSPMPQSIPLPPLSIPTYLQLELASERPSQLYIYRSSQSDFPYESSKVKFERLWNFLILPFQLEQILWFGTLACLDAWLYTFTILPMRFLKALWVLAQWWSNNAFKEASDLASFVYQGVGRLWQRRRGASLPPTPADELTKPRRPSISTMVGRENGFVWPDPGRKSRGMYRHRRTKSTPSLLQPSHKADILKGLLVVVSSAILMRFDASRMYHNIRGQAAIKLYVIYNVLEVCDRLFSAIGQDVLECLFSRETLERNEDGRSKVIRPFWMFLLALGYNVFHATALFYQVITLNVAVNSYSNALLTLLMSNQFVEIKGTVFKKFEKENLFQLTCADVVERFQLWLMLTIIAMRNIVEVGGFSIGFGGSSSSLGSSTSSNIGPNTTSIPLRSSIIPKSFTLVPTWAGQVLGPFLIVLGSEMLVDWLKHCYVTKFNNVRPVVYGRFLDVLAKDYYSHAFADQNLTKRLGLPVLPLSCLFIRALVQTYHMFLATHVPMPIPPPASPSAVSESSSLSSPATTKALEHVDMVFRRALGRSSFGAGVSDGGGPAGEWSWDDLIAVTTMVVVFLVAFLLLLAAKLVLGMLLLSYARTRYRDMKRREAEAYTTAEAKRMGGWGTVEVGEGARRWVYADDPAGLEGLRRREERGRQREKEGGGGETVKLEGVARYGMVGKRIW